MSVEDHKAVVGRWSGEVWGPDYNPGVIPRAGRNAYVDDEPTAGQLALFHRFSAGDLADGIAFGATGRLYVAMASSLGAGVTILGPNGDGTVVARLTNPRSSPFAPYANNSRRLV